MHGTREHVLQLVLERREARAEELAEAIGITAAAVRRHLDNLRADGLVDLRSVKQVTGRPYYAYFATERGRGLLPEGYANLLERVLQSVEARHELTEVARGVAESVASRHLGEVSGAPPASEQRIIEVTDSLRQEGILERWHRDADGFHLVNGSCPYRKAAEFSRLPCESDRTAIEILLGEDVRQVARIVDGAPVCEYLVSNADREAMNQGDYGHTATA